MSWRSDIKVVVAIEFGAKYSGFAYVHRSNPELVTNDRWPEQIGPLKTNTVLQYDEKYENVLEWGYPAFAKRPQRRGHKKNFSNEPVKLFNLHLSSMPDSEKPPLPKSLHYKKAITDYLREIEYPIRSLRILRECVYNAELIRYFTSEKLQFITELEAASMHCVQVLREYFGTSKESFLIANCGDDTVDLITRKFRFTDVLGEVTKQTGDSCCFNYVEKEFIKLLKHYMGDEAMKILEHSDQMQYVMKEFFKVTFSFSGNPQDFKLYEFDLEEVCPIIKSYVTGSYKEKLEKAEWTIELDFKTIKSLFDPAIERIIRLISGHLNKGDKYDILFLIGDFSESRYLVKRIREEFADKMKGIVVPKQPKGVIVRGAAEYASQMFI
ncbi:hypothetical protein Glove_33g262 [Diversispora epigaea]|uniref:Hsp70 family protein n=1 Tax=Diversispora epigaea TaxID=1348612 RepID=A0A397JGT6_9GLOM|nr:hypothetical protein Glove_33g262 [Diversispora epigaea]